MRKTGSSPPQNDSDLEAFCAVDREEGPERGLIRTASFLDLTKRGDKENLDNMGGLRDSCSSVWHVARRFLGVRGDLLGSSVRYGSEGGTLS